MARFRQSKVCGGSVRILIRSAKYQLAATRSLESNLWIDSHHFFNTYSEPYILFVIYAARNLSIARTSTFKGVIQFQTKQLNDRNALCLFVILALSQRRMNKRRDSGLPSGPCRTPGCDLFGTPRRDGLCSRCYDQVHPPADNRTPSPVAAVDTFVIIPTPPHSPRSDTKPQPSAPVGWVDPDLYISQLVDVDTSGAVDNASTAQNHQPPSPQQDKPGGQTRLGPLKIASRTARRSKKGSTNSTSSTESPPASPVTSQASARHPSAVIDEGRSTGTTHAKADKKSPSASRGTLPKLKRRLVHRNSKETETTDVAPDSGSTPVKPSTDGVQSPVTEPARHVHVDASAGNSSSNLKTGTLSSMSSMVPCSECGTTIHVGSLLCTACMKKRKLAFERR